MNEVHIDESVRSSWSSPRPPQQLVVQRIVIFPELADVLSAIVSRVRGTQPSVPLVVAYLNGRSAWISDPLDGCRTSDSLRQLCRAKPISHEELVADLVSDDPVVLQASDHDSGCEVYASREVFDGGERSEAAEFGQATQALQLRPETRRRGHPARACGRDGRGSWPPGSSTCAPARRWP